MKKTKEIRTIELLNQDIDKEDSALSDILHYADTMLSMGVDTETICKTLNIDPIILAKYGFIDSSELKPKKYVIPVKAEITCFVEVETEDIEVLPHLINKLNSDDVFDEFLTKVEKNIGRHIDKDACILDVANIRGTECLYKALEEISLYSKAYNENQKAEFNITPIMKVFASAANSNTTKGANDMTTLYGPLLSEDDEKYAIKEQEEEVLKSEYLEGYEDEEDEVYSRDEALEAQADEMDDEILENNDEDWDDEVFC